MEIKKAAKRGDKQVRVAACLVRELSNRPSWLVQLCVFVRADGRRVSKAAREVAAAKSQVSWAEFPDHSYRSSDEGALVYSYLSIVPLAVLACIVDYC